MTHEQKKRLTESRRLFSEATPSSSRKEALRLFLQDGVENIQELISMGASEKRETPLFHLVLMFTDSLKNAITGAVDRGDVSFQRGSSFVSQVTVLEGFIKSGAPIGELARQTVFLAGIAEFLEVEE